MRRDYVSNRIMLGLGTSAMITVLSVSLISCAGKEPSGVLTRPELANCCEIAGVAGARVPSIAGDSTSNLDPCDRSRIPTIDDEFACLAKNVPGGFGGAYLDDNLRQVVVLVDPSQREAALSTLHSLRALSADIDWNRARVVKGDYDFGQLYHWYRNRVKQVLRCDNINFLDIDEVRNRIVLGVLDQDAAECVARDVLALGDVPCEAVLVETGVSPLIPR